MVGYFVDLKVLLDVLELECCYFIGMFYGGEVGLLFVKVFLEWVQFFFVIVFVFWFDVLFKCQVWFWCDLVEVDCGLFYDVVVICFYSGDFLECIGIFFDSWKVEFGKLLDDFFISFVCLCDVFLSFYMLLEVFSGIFCLILFIGVGSDVFKILAYSCIMEVYIFNVIYMEIFGVGYVVVIEQLKIVIGYLKAFIEKYV